jgi:RNA polymerase sigma-70 factor (ECF subfamily)
MALPQGRALFDQRMTDSLPAALKFAIRLTGRIDAAEELVQEAMLRATRSWATYRNEASFHTWLFQIIINLHREFVTRKRPHETLEQDSTDPNQHPPDAIAAGNELEFIVARCVSELPIRQREVLVLSVYEGFSTEEIAHALQTTAANVYSTLNVARSKLRARLEKYLNMASERVIP